MTMPVILHACEWLEATPWSVALHESIWVYPVIESVHVLTLCMFVGMTVVMDLRLVGAIFRDVPTPAIVERLGPWIRIGFGVMAVSGVLLFSTTPVKFYENGFFRAKLALLVFAGVNAWLYHRRAMGGRVAGAVSLVLWAAVIATGRMIAYNWFG